MELHFELLLNIFLKIYRNTLMLKVLKVLIASNSRYFNKIKVYLQKCNTVVTKMSCVSDLNITYIVQLPDKNCFWEINSK